MANGKSLEKHEKAYIDYISGMKYKDIAEKYNVKVNTIKSWKRRHGWSRENALKKVCKDAMVQDLGNILEIKEDMIDQLKSKGTDTKDNIHLVEQYIKLCVIVDSLNKDIEQRGVTIQWKNGEQVGFKKNDSLSELGKMLKTMLEIKVRIGLIPTPKVDDDDEI
ncbi:P27 family phage terminase small subunit [Paraclostridium tenue]|uniref:Terminase ATPase subunit N-terminal domain-containing protein n=1 Tax=Paraclostridium tenue TaxID=1737 RepID=A0ABN1M997_9FIRM